MDCSQIEILMLKHMDCIISPNEAKELAKHVEKCESCREYYLAFDQAMEGMETATEEAPAGFVASVMTEVRKMPAYTKPQPVQRSNPVLHVIWGISAVVVAAALFFIYNPHHLTNLAYQYPIVESFIGFANSIINAFAQLTDAITYDPQTIGSSFAIAALVFVFIFSSLLVVLHKEEGIA